MPALEVVAAHLVVSVKGAGGLGLGVDGLALDLRGHGHGATNPDWSGLGLVHKLAGTGLGALHRDARVLAARDLVVRKPVVFVNGGASLGDVLAHALPKGLELL